MLFSSSENIELELFLRFSGARLAFMLRVKILPPYLRTLHRLIHTQLCNTDITAPTIATCEEVGGITIRGKF